MINSKPDLLVLVKGWVFTRCDFVTTLLYMLSQLAPESFL